jgi:hypothetical protein
MDADIDEEEIDMNGAGLYKVLDRCRGSIHMPVRSRGSSRRRAIQPNCSNRSLSFSNTRIDCVVRLYRLQQFPTIRMKSSTTRTLRSKTTRNGLYAGPSSFSTFEVKKRRVNTRNDVMETSKKRKL